MLDCIAEMRRISARGPRALNRRLLPAGTAGPARLRSGAIAFSSAFSPIGSWNRARSRRTNVQPGEAGVRPLSRASVK